MSKLFNVEANTILNENKFVKLLNTNYLLKGDEFGLTSNDLIENNNKFIIYTT